MTSPRARLLAPLIAAALLAVAMPARAGWVGTETYSSATVDTPLKLKGWVVTIETLDSDALRSPLPAPPSVTSTPDPDPRNASVCVSADKETSSKRTRTAIREYVCPGATTGFLLNPATMSATLNAEIATTRWTRVWKVKGNRWRLVKDQTVGSKAVASILWQGSGTARTEPAFCGFGPGVERRVPANVSGTLTFPNVKLTVPLDGATGTLTWGACTDVNPF